MHSRNTKNVSIFFSSVIINKCQNFDLSEHEKASRLKTVHFISLGTQNAQTMVNNGFLLAGLTFIGHLQMTVIEFTSVSL